MRCTITARGPQAVHRRQLRRDTARPARVGAVRPRAWRVHRGGTRRVGRFEQADGGTLFLDEIGDMPLDCRSSCCACWRNASLIAWAANPIKIDVRLIAATNQDLDARGGRFREDLFYRLNVIRITHRRCDNGEDIPSAPGLPGSSGR